MIFDLYWSRFDEGYHVEYAHLINGAAFRENLRLGRPIEVKVKEVALKDQQHGKMSRRGSSIPRDS